MGKKVSSIITPLHIPYNVQEGNKGEEIDNEVPKKSLEEMLNSISDSSKKQLEDLQVLTLFIFNIRAIKIY